MTAHQHLKQTVGVTSLKLIFPEIQVRLTCRVLHTKSLLSSPQTLCAATTNTSTRKTNTMDSQILPKAVEYLLTPLNRLSNPDQFIPAAAALAWVKKPSAPCRGGKQGCVSPFFISFIKFEICLDLPLGGNAAVKPALFIIKD